MTDFQKTLTKVIENTNEIFGAEAASIALLNPSKKEIVIQAAVGSGSNSVQGMALPVGKGLVGWVTSHAQSVIVPDVTQDYRFYPVVDQTIGFQTRSIMCVPIQVDGHIVGVIELINVQSTYLNDGGLKILTMLAEYAALAIENSNLLAETHQWSKQQSLLFQSKVEVSQNRALETILTVVSQQMIELLAADLCIISRWDNKKNSLHILRQYVKPELGIAETILPGLHTSPMGWVLKTRIPKTIKTNMPNISETDQEWLALLDVEMLLLIPLIHHRQVIGLVEVGCKDSACQVTKDELRLAETVVAQAATAIEQARLYDETTRRLAETTVLQEVMMAAAFTLNFDDILQDTIQALHRTLGIERIIVFLPTANRDAAVAHPASLGFEILNTQVTVPLKNSAMGWVMQYGEPLLLRHVRDVKNYYELMADTESAMYVPVMLNDRVEAVLRTESPRLNAFSEFDLQLLNTIAIELATALKNAKLYQTERRLSRQRQAMVDTFADLSSELKLEHLFQRIIERAVKVIPHADAGSLIIPTTDKFVYAAATGFDLHKLQQFTFVYDSFYETIPPQQQVRRLTQAELINDSKQVVSLTKNKFHQYGPAKIKCTIQAGLYSGDEILGLLSIDSLSSDQAFINEDEQALLIFANQAAIALQNARMFNEIHTAEANYRNLFDNANDFILVLDSKFRLLTANKVALTTTGYTLPEVIGRRASSFVVPYQKNSLYQIIKKRLQTQQSTTLFEVSILGKDKQEILLEVNIRVQRQNSQSAEIHCIARDITQRRILEQELQQTERLSAIGKLVAGVAHELNNPLTTVIGYASLLQDNELPENFRADLDAICRHAQRARSIVRDLLTFARKVNLNTKPININNLLEASLLQMKPHLQTYNTQVVSQLDKKNPLIMGDPHQLGQVFINLLNNASQALADVKYHRQITVTSTVKDNQVLIRVADNGPGIPENVLGKIFEPFFSTKQMGQGTGLGLSICFGIIQEHEGRIWAEKQLEGGATFSVELPIIASSTDQPTVKEENNYPALSGNRSTLTILTIDDEPMVLELLQRVLERAGHSVETATNGQLALEKLKQSTYDLIICDVVMPHLSGIEFYKTVTKQQPNLARQFMFITGNTTDMDTKNFLDDLKLPWMAKPFLPLELEKIVANYASSKQK